VSEDFDPVAFAVANPPKGSGHKSRLDTPKVRAWILALCDAYEAGKLERWDWVHVAKVIRSGDPSMPAESAVRDFVLSKMPEVADRIAKAR
jgi:hypothetical protein